jgi:hypothetical protein
VIVSYHLWNIPDQIQIGMSNHKLVILEFVLFPFIVLNKQLIIELFLIKVCIYTTDKNIWEKFKELIKQTQARKTRFVAMWTPALDLKHQFPRPYVRTQPLTIKSPAISSSSPFLIIC